MRDQADRRRSARRRARAVVGVGLLVAGSGLLLAAVSQQAADLVLVNGRVYTADDGRPWAEAVAVRGDRLVHVGTSVEVEALVGPATKRIDLGGAFVVPGFNDAHVHVDQTGALLTGVNLLDVHEPAAFPSEWPPRPPGSRRAAGSRAATGAPTRTGAPVRAGPARRRHPAPRFVPDRALIDTVTADHPVLVNRFDRSVFLANARALELASIGPDTPSPEGGEIARDETGRLTGVLTGTAVDLVRKSSRRSLRAAARAGARGARRGARERRDDHPGPELARAGSRVSGTAPPRRADREAHACGRR
jgi:predicted amidohydrolase YtcJ